MDRPEAIFRALSDPARLRILRALARPETECCSTADQVCACDLEPLLGLAQPTISHHMKLLTDAGLVEARRSGRWVPYQLDREQFHELAGWLMAMAGNAPAPSPLSPPL